MTSRAHRKSLHNVFYVTFVSIVFATYVSYSVQPYSFWTSRGVSGPRPKPFLGNAPLIITATKENVLTWREKYGHIFGIFMFRRPVLVVTDYDLMKEIAVKEADTFIDRFVVGDGKLHNYIIRQMIFFSKGQIWKRMRQIVTPTYSTGKIKKLTGHMNHSSGVLLQELCQIAKAGKKVDVKKCFGDFSMNSIAATAFSMNLESENSGLDSFVKHAKSILAPEFKKRALFLLEGIFPLVNRILEKFTDLQFVDPEDVKFFDQMIKRMVEERNAHSTKSQDYLELLLNAESTDSSTGGKVLDHDEVVAQCVMFFLAGYETTATALQFVTYALATHPDIQDRLIAEIEDGVTNEEVTYEDVKGLKYLDAVVQETLRMYPPVPNIYRQNIRPTTVAGISLPIRTGILFPLLTVLYNPELYPEPEKFNPDRFLTNKSSTIPIAFGIGARHCVGLNFALVEMKIALVHMLRKVMFTDPPKGQLEMQADVTLIPITPIELGVVLR